MDNERSTQGTSAPLLPLLQRFQNIHGSKEECVSEEESEVTFLSSPGAASVNEKLNKPCTGSPVALCDQLKRSHCTSVPLDLFVNEASK